MTSSSRDYELQWELEVLDQIRALPRELQRSVIRRCAELSGDPRPINVEKLEVSYRMAFDRVLVWYWVDDANGLIVIVRVALDAGARPDGA